MNVKHRAKPKIADLNRQQAEKNITLKINLLAAWCNHGVPEQKQESSGKNEGNPLEYFPKSVRQFNAWDGSQNSVEIRETWPKFGRNANDTLRSHPQLRQAVEKILSALVSKAATQLRSYRPTKMARLQDELKIESRLRTILETELVQLRINVIRKTREATSAKVRLEGRTREFKAQQSILEEENARLLEECAKLRKQLMKVAPLRPVKHSAP